MNIDEILASANGGSTITTSSGAGVRVTAVEGGIRLKAASGASIVLEHAAAGGRSRDWLAAALMPCAEALAAANERVR